MTETTSSNKGQQFYDYIFKTTKASNNTNNGGTGDNESDNEFATLGAINIDVTLGNPLKGLVISPRSIAFKPSPHDLIPYSLEFYYIGLDEILLAENTFDWTTFETIVSDCATKRYCHIIPRIYIHYPGQPLRIPQFLLDKIKLEKYYNAKHGEGISPVYSDPILLEVLKDFITEFGQRYDGDHRIAFIQMGLLGFWGEWHTNEGPADLLPEWVKDQVVGWYSDAFHITKLQTRNPRDCVSEKSGIGYHDDSFAFTTIDGEANGTGPKKNFFWSIIVANNVTDFWKYGGIMGGEVRPELCTTIFEPSYPARTPNHQDFIECCTITHTTYMKNSYLFRPRKFTNISDDVVRNANHASCYMGYNFIIPQISIRQSEDSTFTVDVTIQQIGIAPFYYPLDLVLSTISSDDSYTQRKQDIENDLIEQNTTKTYEFIDVPFEYIHSKFVVTLDSKYVYKENPIKFAQGNDGTVSFQIPSSDTTVSIK